MNTLEGNVPCSICGAEHDPKETPELDSTHLCAVCATNERALRCAPTLRAPLLHADDAE